MVEEGIHLVAALGEVRRAAVVMALAVRPAVVVVAAVQVVQMAVMVEEEGYRIMSRRGNI